MKKLFILIIFSLICIPAFAATDWLQVKPTRFLYIPSIKKTGNITSVWVKVIPKNKTKGEAYTLFHHQYDCINKKVKIDKIFVYNSKDEIITKGKPNDGWRAIKSGSLFEKEGGLLCTYKVNSKSNIKK